MTTPIFSSPLSIKKYILQTRSQYKPWQEYASYKNPDQAKRVAQELLRQNPNIETRIFNRLTDQVVQRFVNG